MYDMKKLKKNKKDKRSSWIYMKKCIPYFLLDKKSLIILLITSIIVAITDSFIPAIIGYVLDFVTNLNLNKAIFFCFITICLGLLVNVLRLLLNRSFVKLQNTVVETIRKDVINAYFNIQNKILIKTSSGVFLSRIQQDPKSIFNAFASIRNNMSNLLGNIFVLFYMFYINPIIGLITLIGTI